jgi:hypothetical protein
MGQTNACARSICAEYNRRIMMEYNRRIMMVADLVTGEAKFIGSHVRESLIWFHRHN